MFGPQAFFLKGLMLNQFFRDSNDQTSSITAAEINLMGTVTTDITNGIQGLTLDNFVF
ncbi:MAG: hypothetical protein CM15mP62_26140 [Rhodospirillaceae bacterium]|nr:MAG: hypothetical protein CM15mP62_26140 [Rhodospirillaceae bacterium]